MAYKITEKRQLVPDVHLMNIQASDVAAAAKAGQFIILRIDEAGERIPLTIADYNADEGSVTIIFQEMGKTTKQLAKMSAGEELLDFVGPLGKKSEIEKIGTVVLVGGGVGIAPIYPQAKEYRAAGNKVISIIGARNKGMLILEDEMIAASDEVLVATDDGSKGHHGFVTDLVKQLLDGEEHIDRIVAIGPPIMMRAVAGVTASYDVETLVSLNPIMVDGTGMCGGCRVNVGGEVKFACVDGPEFNAKDVDFNLLMSRLSFYRKEEADAITKSQKGCGDDCKCQ
ncbi:sulfide/dihydroorotate dehydrogenase-like FAD/NAD-binding protein [Methanococcoides alaskense]|uniref:Ferredoxin--NADP+ reductase/dihydroorotate dehydrogenase electron transfer subunit n=1 Tax=Methanococcoides alaskense TaxID=325778 RepID=A0AA90TYE2_9EURY|nr:sulfide/dihydroorotate dehydrogenase-like FAD/NAD-binding protein [Methanococcoides alaskense]MDA0525096.1 sulfide/dihydroorotate dehydrogenase-like FAD/NAD-binding protein [Methanococcoides alaskense]MDR6221983.1 ferredoxin--NADP+ reductase/dihydroorotate dehydrogenase electron transfer subunit [Methanococcoides alaskense]